MIVRPARMAAVVATVVGFVALLAGTSLASETDELSRERVNYYADRYQVSEGEAVRRLGLQGRAVKVNLLLHKSIGVRLTAVWFDNQAGEIVVGVKNTRDVSLVRRVLDREGVEEQARTLVMGYGRDDLRHKLTNLINRFRAQVASREMSFGISQGRIYAIVPTESDAAPSRAKFATDTDVPVVVRTVPRSHLRAVPAACSRPYCDDLMGGIGWRTQTTPTYTCSSAFVVSRPLVKFLLTAGHCVEPSLDAVSGQELPYVGWMTCEVSAPGLCRNKGLLSPQYAFGDRGDYGMISFLSPPLSYYDGVVDWTTSSVRPVAGYFEVDPPTGLTLCKHTRSGTLVSNCGTVWATDTAVVYRMGRLVIVRHITAVRGMCSLGGDSGGAITFDLLGHLAGVGILSGGSDSQCSASSSTYVSPLYRALDDLGVTFP